MELTSGTRLGPYEILGPLGAGGMGRVFRARDVKLDRPVAIKVLRDDCVHDPVWLARFDREARRLATLSHPNIATVHGLDEVDGLRYLVMELVPGQTLAQRLTSGPLPAAEALAVGKQIAEGLEAAHDRDIVHRDLKPANVVLTPDGKVKILDFGLARSTETLPWPADSTGPDEPQTRAGGADPGGRPGSSPARALVAAARGRGRRAARVRPGELDAGPGRSRLGGAGPARRGDAGLPAAAVTGRSVAGLRRDPRAAGPGR